MSPSGEIAAASQEYAEDNHDQDPPEVDVIAAAVVGGPKQPVEEDNQPYQANRCSDGKGD